MCKIRIYTVYMYNVCMYDAYICKVYRYIICVRSQVVFLLIQAPNLTIPKANFPTFKVSALGSIFTVSVVWQR